MWQRARSSSKAGFDKLWNVVDKLGAPTNRLANKLGSEAFWPTTLDKECDKAARILRSFCKDGFYEEVKEGDAAVGSRHEGSAEVEGPSEKRYAKVLKKIPTEVMKNAKGLAIFTTMRTGLWVSGAGGSGVLIARLPDGSWSQPSGIMLHTAGLGFLIGVDIYDCVMVLNTQEALDSFSKIRCTVGGEVSAVAGPVGMGGVLDSEVHKRRAPIFTYLKSRGFYAGVQLDGTVIIERTDENERFYGRKIGVRDILAGRISNPPLGSARLIETIRAAQGDANLDGSLLTDEAPPSDFAIEQNTTSSPTSEQLFGVPAKEDPDPYGFLALQQEGLVIREAGTNSPAKRESFQFLPSPTSPLFKTFHGARKSADFAVDASRRSSWRTSGGVKMDMSTQTDDLPPLPASPTTPGRPKSAPALPPRPQSHQFVANMEGIPERSEVENIAERMASASTEMQTQTDARSEEITKNATHEMGVQANDNNGAGFHAEQTFGGEPTIAIHPVPDAARSDNDNDNDRPFARTSADSDKRNGIIALATATTPQSLSISTTTAPPLPHTTSSADIADLPLDAHIDADDEDSDSDLDLESPAIISQVITAQPASRIVTAQPQVLSKARLVTVGKAVPPALPSRNPNRSAGRGTSPLPSPGLLGTGEDGEMVLPTAGLGERRPSRASRLSTGSSVYSMHAAESIDDPSHRGSESLDSVSSVEHDASHTSAAASAAGAGTHALDSNRNSFPDHLAPTASTIAALAELKAGNPYALENEYAYGHAADADGTNNNSNDDAATPVNTHPVAPLGGRAAVDVLEEKAAAATMATEAETPDAGRMPGGFI